MTLTLDHVFVCPEDAPAAESALAGFGLQFGRRGVHDNAYLELLWRFDDDELQSETVGPVALWERVRSRESGPLRALCDLGVFRTRQAAEPLLELDWDDAHSNGFHDFRPALPLILRW